MERTTARVGRQTGATARECALEKLSVLSQSRVLESAFFAEAAPDVGPALLILRGAAPDSRAAGDELWQAFVVGGSDQVWSAVVRSADTVASNDRARVSFGEAARDGAPGYWPVRVHASDAEQSYRWDGAALVLDP